MVAPFRNSGVGYNKCKNVRVLFILLTVLFIGKFTFESPGINKCLCLKVNQINSDLTRFHGFRNVLGVGISLLFICGLEKDRLFCERAE